MRGHRGYTEGGLYGIGVLHLSVWDHLKKHWQGYEQKPDSILSESTTKFIDKIHSAYSTVKKH